MKIDFHVHTDLSPCSDMSLENAVETAINKGLCGIAICNHNIPFSQQDIPYHLENKFNITINPKTKCDNPFYIISGIETNTEIGHVLHLFTSTEGVDEITVLAHPFEQAREYTKHSEFLVNNKNLFNLVETHSGRANYKNKNACKMAEHLCDTHSILRCAGSDAHFPEEIGNAWVEFNDELVGLKEIKKAILENNCTFFYKNAKRITVAKSQIVKNKNLKSILFFIYSYIRDIGDTLCQR